MSLIDLPSANQIMASTSAYSVPFFNEFFPYALVGLGILLAFVLILFISRAFLHGFNHLGGRSWTPDMQKRYENIRHEDVKHGYQDLL